MLPVDKALQQDFGLKDSNGALVKAVQPNSPASAAKLLPGDVIRSINGKPIKNSEEIQRIVRRAKVGDVLQIDVLRNSTVKQKLTLKIGSRPEE
jgi:S1-C subfamily serine protease